MAGQSSQSPYEKTSKPRGRNSFIIIIVIVVVITNVGVLGYLLTPASAGITDVAYTEYESYVHFEVHVKNGGLLPMTVVVYAEVITENGTYQAFWPTNLEPGEVNVVYINIVYPLGETIINLQWHADTKWIA